MKIYDCIIVGAGPAGIQASIYIKRTGMNPIVFYKGESELEKAEKIDNYYGFEDGISGKELFEKGIMQATNLGIEIKKEEILNIEMEDNLEFKVKSENDTYQAKAVILATGLKRIVPKIENIEKYINKGVSFCALCDGYFYKGKNVVVIGDGKNAIEEADVLKKVAKSVRILTSSEIKSINGTEQKVKSITLKNDINECKGNNGESNQEEVNKNKASERQFIECNSILGEKNSKNSNSSDSNSKNLNSNDSNEIQVDGVFIAEGIAGGFEFAKRMGIITKNETIVVNDKMQTNVPGVFACGNITGGLLQVSKAVYEGAEAGINVVNYIKFSGK